LPIDPDFQKRREKIGKEKGIAVWGPVDPPERLGVRGTNVAVDWDICTGCGICLEICPVQMYEWRETPGHPTSDRKPFPAKAAKCMSCYRCEKQCPAKAIRVTFGGPQSVLDLVTGLMMPVQFIAGPIYGVVFGPYFSSMFSFYVGWVVLVLGFPFLLSPLIYFSKSGKPAKNKSLMDTTVVVDSGTYSIVRHPQFLGGVLLMIASILISQHWLAAIVSAPFIVLICTKWVREAEEHLILKFGDDYKRYMERVPRMNFLLGIIRLLRKK